MWKIRSRHHSYHHLRITLQRWLQTLLRSIDLRKSNDQSSYQIRLYLSKTKQNSSIDCQQCKASSKRMRIDILSSEWQRSTLISD
jgi:hypothetical protein